MPAIPGYAFGYFLVFRPLYHITDEGHIYNVALGIAIGYMIYDEMHYFMHHSNPSSGFLKTMKIYHMQHHYKFGTIGFGVSSKFWDIVFGSGIDTEDAIKNLEKMKKGN